MMRRYQSLSLRQQPPDIKRSSSRTSTTQPSLANAVIVLSSSDSEDSPAPSPPWKKSRGIQHSAKAATCLKATVKVSSETEKDEDIIMPLAERLKRKLLGTTTSFTRIQEWSNQDSGGGKGRSSNDEQVPTDCLQRSLSKAPGTKRRTEPSTWELSDSDQDVTAWDPQKLSLLQPLHCLTGRSVQNSSHPMAEEYQNSFPVETKTNHSQKKLARAHQVTLQRTAQAAPKVLQKLERERKKALADLWKTLRPGECLKYIQVALDPGLLEMEGGGQVLTALQSLGCSYVIESHAVPRSVIWRRKTSLAPVEQVNWTDEPNILVLVLLEEFVSMIGNYKQVNQEGSTETLQSFVADIMKKTTRKIPALVVVDLEQYFSSHKPNSGNKLQQAVQSDEAQKRDKQRNWKGKAAMSVPKMSRVDVEEALVDLQLHTSVQVRVLESWKELSGFVRKFTKAVAEAPFKKERNNTSFSFCLEKKWRGSSKVDRTGKGLLQVWKRQIQQFNRVSQETADAIVAKYPSPLLLIQGYEACSSEQEQQNLLAEIPVRRGDGVTATTRRVGPELSKRIYLQMTSSNPEISLDVTA